MEELHNSMWVYRIQNAYDQGCLLGTDTPCYVTYPEELRLHRANNMPDGSECRQHPDDDAGTDLQKAYFKKHIYHGSKYIFGFANKKDLYTWFTPVDLGWYEGHGYAVYAYDIPTQYIIFGTRQVCFNPVHARMKQRLGHRKLRLA